MILHNDIDMPFAKTDAEPVYLAQTKALFKRHPKATIIWAHTGLGRVVHPAQVTANAAERSPRHVETLEAMLTDPALSHLSFDISWDEVAKYAVSSPEAVARVAAMLNKYPDRFLFGTDTVAPAGPAPYFAVFDMWAPVFKQLTPEASPKVRKGNYERIFDEARRRVRAWEAANAKSDSDATPPQVRATFQRSNVVRTFIGMAVLAVLLIGPAMVLAQQPVSRTEEVSAAFTIEAIDHSARVVTLRNKAGLLEEVYLRSRGAALRRPQSRRHRHLPLLRDGRDRPEQTRRRGAVDDGHPHAGRPGWQHRPPGLRYVHHRDDRSEGG